MNKRLLYPVKKPIKKGYLQVSKQHDIFYAVYGNPKGIPVIVLHGGPGAGTSDDITSFFDLRRYYVVMFDQRGAMRSKPLGCMDENSTQHLIGDIEKLRELLGIEKWVIYGGSWGSALSMLYGEAHPKRCLGFILRGIFLGRKDDHHQVLIGAGKVYPEAFDELKQTIPKREHKDLFGAIQKKVLAGDQKVARDFIRFNALIATHKPNPKLVEKRIKDKKLVLSMATAFFFYAAHDFFLKPNQILSKIHTISHLPCIIVHGRHDVICLPESAFTLHTHWEKSKLWMIPDGGHADKDPPIAQALARANREMHAMVKLSISSSS